MHICSSWLYTWLPTSDNIKASGEQAKAKISSAYTKISLFLLQFYFLSFYFFPTFLLERVADPIQNQPFVKLQFAPLGLVPKKDGDLRLIHHLSYPEGHSINGFIDPRTCSVYYSSIDEAASINALFGNMCTFVKVGHKAAFCTSSLSPSDFDLLGFKFQSQTCFDKM